MAEKIINDKHYIPYFQTTRYRVAAMVELAEVSPQDILADLGSGDGRILIAFAQKGIQTHGYELDNSLLLEAQQAIAEKKLQSLVHLHNKDFWQEDLSPFSIVTVYGMPDVMEGLKEKFLKELRPGTRVLTNYYSIPGLTHDAEKDHIFKYIIR